jgi:phage baseplate assembly protein W
MEMDFTKYSVEELRQLQNKIGNYIHNLNDGFVYICQVRSYGNNWKSVLTNERAVNDLCEQYDGYDGIVDVYTTNPDANISNYGEVNYIKSVEGYEKWKQSNVLMDLIKSTENEIERFNKGERPFNPQFGSDFKKLLFEPLTDILTESIKENILMSINTFIPEIIVTGMDIIPNIDTNSISAMVSYKLKISGTKDKIYIDFSTI